MKQSGVDLSTGAQEARRLISATGFAISPESDRQLSNYVNKLIECNSKVNLVSRADISNIWVRHLFHSVTPLLLFDLPRNIRFLDIGSGGGFPGIPISILRPDFRGVLVDSIGKKTAALSSIVESMGMKNVSVVNARVESASFVTKFRASFDLVFARAVAPLSDLMKWSVQLMDASNRLSGGFQLPAIIAFKGGDLSNEISDVHRLFPRVSIEEVPVRLEGIPDSLFEDKKIVIVRP